MHTVGIHSICVYIYIYIHRYIYIYIRPKRMCCRRPPGSGSPRHPKSMAGEQKNTSEPPEPHPSFLPFMERGDFSWLYTAIINTTPNLHQRSQPRMHRTARSKQTKAIETLLKTLKTLNLSPKSLKPKP